MYVSGNSSMQLTGELIDAVGGDRLELSGFTEWPVRIISVDRRRTRIDDRDWRAGGSDSRGCIQNRYGSHRVDLVGTEPILTQARNGGDGGKMKYRFHAMNRSARRFRISDIPSDQFYPREQILRLAGG